jgi:hypothetical protein
MRSKFKGKYLEIEPIGKSAYLLFGLMSPFLHVGGSRTLPGIIWVVCIIISFSKSIVFFWMPLLLSHDHFTLSERFPAGGAFASCRLYLV